jgi:hypothetical protein
MAAERLRAAAGDGRISIEELDRRLGAAFTAATYADLESVTADLPPAPVEMVAAEASQRAIRFAVSGGSIDRFGQWEIPSRIDLELNHATSTLDFRTSVVPPTGVHIDIRAQRSRIRLLVPPDMRVDLDSLGRHRATVADRYARRGSTRELHALRVTGDIYRGSLRVLRRPFQLF